MNRFGAQVIAVSWLVISLGLVSLAAGVGHENRLELSKVYEYKFPDTYEDPLFDLSVKFDPDNPNLVYVLRQRSDTVKLLDWRNDRIVRELDFSSLCPDEVRVIDLWPIPASNRMVVDVYCGQGNAGGLYVADRRTGQIENQILDRTQNRGTVVDVALSGAYVAILAGPHNLNESEDHIVLYDTGNWTISARFSVTRSFPDAAFVPGADREKLVALRWAEGSQRQERCGIKIVEIESGKQIQNLVFHTKDTGCWEWLYGFTPDGQYLVTNRGFGTEMRVSLVNWRTGEVAQEFLAEEVPVSVMDLSADGRWLAASVWYDPRKTPVATLRAYKIWDLASGQVVYESPAISRLAALLSGHWGKKPPARVQFSPDSNYILQLSQSGLEILKLQVVDGR